VINITPQSFYFRERTLVLIKEGGLNELRSLSGNFGVEKNRLATQKFELQIFLPKT
jgi:hypothetical protein